MVGVLGVSGSRIKDTETFRGVLFFEKGVGVLVGFGRLPFFAQQLLPLLYYATVIQPNPKTYYEPLLRSMFSIDTLPCFEEALLARGVRVLYAIQPFFAQPAYPTDTGLR